MQRTFSRVLSVSILAVVPGVLSSSCESRAATVTNTLDSGPGSLRHAMMSGDDFIEFALLFHTSPQTIFLDRPLPSIDNDLALRGPGADLLTIDGQFLSNNSALINIYSRAHVVRLEGFTLTGGYDAISTGDVGGIFTRGHVTLADIELTNNRGTGIFNQVGNLTIENSTVSDNTGEGLFNQGGNATIVNSTFAQNREGVYNQVGDLTVLNSTVAKNSTNGLSSVIFSDRGSLRIESSLFADNRFDVSFSHDAVVTNSFVGNSGTSPIANGVDGNIVGFDALLGTLAYNGGSTRTILPKTGSLTIDAGSNPLSLLQDQRGFDRLFGREVDIGAVERVPEPTSLQLLSLAALALVGKRWHT